MPFKVPIISQQGEVAGRLHVQIYRVPNLLGDTGMASPMADEDITHPSSLLGKVITCRVRIKRASGLPEALSNFVFCQYSFFNISEMLVVAPNFDPLDGPDAHSKATSFKFEHQKDFSVVVTEEFLEYVQDDALSIEVWGHRSCEAAEERFLDAEEKSKSLQVGMCRVCHKQGL